MRPPGFEPGFNGFLPPTVARQGWKAAILDQARLRPHFSCLERGRGPNKPYSMRPRGQPCKILTIDSTADVLMGYKHTKEVIEEVAEMLTQSVFGPIGIAVGLAILVILALLLHRKKHRAANVLHVFLI